MDESSSQVFKLILSSTYSLYTKVRPETALLRVFSSPNLDPTLDHNT